MAWYVASVPFWILGGLCFIGALGSIRWGQETTNGEARQFLVASLAAGGFFVVAASLVCL